MARQSAPGVIRAALHTERFVVLSRLDVDVVMDRAIRIQDGRLRSKGPAHSATILVGMHGDRLTLSSRHHANNSFRPRLIARLEPTGEGTRISCEIRPLRLVVGFMAVWMTLATGAALLGLSALLDGVVLGAVGVAFPVFGLVLMWGGFRLARGERDVLRHAISDIAGPRSVRRDS